MCPPARLTKGIRNALPVVVLAPQQRMIGSAVDLVISIVNDPVQGRKVQEVAVVNGYENGRYLLTQV